MAKSTFLQFVQVVASECGIPNSSTIGAVTGLSAELMRVVRWVADGDKETQTRWLDWDFLHVDDWSSATSVGVAAVTAPTDIGAWDVDSFYLDYSTDSWSKPKVIDYRYWRDTLRQGTKTNARPSYVVIKPDLSLTLEAPPDAIYTLTADYWSRPVKMVDATDTSLIPEEYERIIVARAKIFYGEYESASEVLAAGQVEYDDLLDKLEAKYLSHSGRRMSANNALVVRPE